MELRNGWELVAMFNHGDIINRQEECVLKKNELIEMNGRIIVNSINEGIFITRKNKMIRFSLVTGKVFE